MKKLRSFWLIYLLLITAQTTYSVRPNFQSSAEIVSGKQFINALKAIRESEIHGNRASRIYHWAGCPNYNDISPKNLIIFTSVKAAEQAGYRAARNCRVTPPPA